MGEIVVNETRAFLGNEAQWSAARIELEDVQGLWGGRIIRIEGGGKATVRLIQTGMIERRYDLRLARDEIKRLVEIFIANDFTAIRPMERPGIPDEARPKIRLTNSAGAQREVSKWAGVKDERFSAVYSTLIQLEAKTTILEPVYTGPFAWDMKS